MGMILKMIGYSIILRIRIHPPDWFLKLDPSPCPQPIRSYHLQSFAPSVKLQKSRLREKQQRENEQLSQTTPSYVNSKADNARKAWSGRAFRIVFAFWAMPTDSLISSPHTPLRRTWLWVTCTQPHPNIGLQPLNWHSFYPNAQCMQGSRRLRKHPPKDQIAES